jgi:GNAT superfamily N-acetyltransferase
LNAADGDPAATLVIGQIKQADRERLLAVLRPQQVDGRLAEQARGHGVFLVGWAGDAPVGYVFVRWEPGEPVTSAAGQAALIEQLGVVAERRNQGIGSMLLNAAERLAAVNGRPAAALAVGTQNRDAERLYRRRGYRPLLLPERYLSWTAWDAEGRTLTEGEWVRYLAKRLPNVAAADGSPPRRPAP